MAVALAVLGLAGCGHGDKKKQSTPVKEAKKARDATARALDEVRKSDLPEDAKRELEEAAKLLEQSPRD